MAICLSICAARSISDTPPEVRVWTAVPVILGSVHATDALLAGRGLLDASHWVKLLAAFDVVFLVVCPLAFEFVLEE